MCLLNLFLIQSNDSLFILNTLFVFTDPSCTSWEGSFPLTDGKEEEEELEDEEADEEEEDRKNSQKEQSPMVKKSRREEALQPLVTCRTSSFPSSGVASCLSACSSSTLSSFSAPPRPSPPPELPVCAKNISLTASGEKVILWTRYRFCWRRRGRQWKRRTCPQVSGEILILVLFFREADRVILTICQQEGANQNSFQSISSLLGNKTPSEVIV